jgi:cell wall-associated NlpC family hydrolase
MHFKRLTVIAALVSALLVVGPLQAKSVHKTVHAKTAHVKAAQVKTAHHARTAHAKLAHTKTVAAKRDAAVSRVAMPALVTAKPNPPAFNLASPLVPGIAALGMVPAGDGAKTAADAVAVGGAAKPVGASGAMPVAAGAESVTDLRKSLIGLAMNLRDTRYVRGGRDPSTGFDCSGFVRYVFAHAIGMKLPTNSAEQFLAGLKVARADMKPGDLVFFHTGRKQRISHVGIYISNGQFIHSPASGKSVEVSSLNESYWAKHFAGAKRPQAIASVASNG